MLKRSFDIVATLMLAITLAVPALIIAIMIKRDSAGPALYWSRRIGQNNSFFMMPKFRTMRTDTPYVATDQLDNPDMWVTNIGVGLRRSSLDEIPQLWCIFTGSMSFVGPRPLADRQTEAQQMRTEHLIHHAKPGVTGWAQINGRDDIHITRKIALDLEYCQKQSFIFDLKILALTLYTVISRKGIAH